MPIGFINFKVNTRVSFYLQGSRRDTGAEWYIKNKRPLISVGSQRDILNDFNVQLNPGKPPIELDKGYWTMLLKNFHESNMERDFWREVKVPRKNNKKLEVKKKL